MGHLTTYSRSDAGTVVWSRLCPVCRKHWIRCSIVRGADTVSEYFLRHGAGEREYVATVAPGDPATERRPAPTDSLVAEFAGRVCR